MPAAQAKISSFGIIKGPMIPESYACLRAWDWSESKVQNIHRFKIESLAGAGSANWVRDVAFAMSSRFDPDGADRPLALLAQKDPGLDLWKPLLFWHWAQKEYLLRMFLLDWLAPRIREGYRSFKSEDLIPTLQKLWGPGGPISEPWTESTTKHVAPALLKIGQSFDLLGGRQVRTLVPYHLPEACFLYVLRSILDREGSPRKAVEAPDWGIFLMEPQAVKQELLRLHQYRKLEYHAAGSLVELTLPYANLLDLVNGWS
jgi:hypothetical protein